MISVVKFSNSRGDFSGSPMAGTSPSNAGVAGIIPGWGTKIPYALRLKNPNHKTKAKL